MIKTRIVFKSGTVIVTSAQVTKVKTSVTGELASLSWLDTPSEQILHIDLAQIAFVEIFKDEE